MRHENNRFQIFSLMILVYIYAFNCDQLVMFIRLCISIMILNKIKNVVINGKYNYFYLFSHSPTSWIIEYMSLIGKQILNYCSHKLKAINRKFKKKLSSTIILCLYDPCGAMDNVSSEFRPGTPAIRLMGPIHW